MDSNEFIAQMERLVDLINDKREEQLVIIAQETYGLVRRRIQLDAEDDQGGKFGDYSEAVVPRWMLTRKTDNKGAISRIESGAWFQSYKDFRSALGVRTDAINFSLTGNTFKQSGITKVKSDGEKTEVSIGGQTDYAKAILAFQDERFGNILRPSTKERNFVKQAYFKRIKNYIKDTIG
jgi:hypothetical protein